MKLRLKALLFAILIMFMCALAAGCGGGGGGGSNPSETTPAYLTGVFLDSAVEGLAYTARPSGISGTTNALGEFDYQAGDTVTFHIGGIELGQAVGKSEVTPIDFESGQNQNGYSQRVRNIIRLLQTLDEDDNPDNGIQLPVDIHDSAATLSADFSQPSADFAADTDIGQLCGGQPLISENQAIDHFELTLQGVAVSTLQGSYTLSHVTLTDLSGNNIMPSGTTITGSMQITSTGSLNQTFYVNGRRAVASGTMEILNHYQLLISSAGCNFYVEYEYDRNQQRLTTIANTSDMTVDGSETIRSCANAANYFIETDVWQKSRTSAMSSSEEDPSTAGVVDVNAFIGAAMSTLE